MGQTPAPLKTRITEMFGLEYPIIAAPMFLVSNEKMVVATGKAGAMGAFPALNFRPIENYEKAIENIQAQGIHKFGINIIAQKSNIHLEEQLDIAIKHEVPLVISSLGSPKRIIEKTRGTKTKVFCDVIGLEHARKVAHAGADGLIAVGSGAGGHGGDNSLFALIPYLKAQLDLPIIAAGCISDGAGMAAAFALGADAIYMGTRFIASKECEVNSGYKEAIVNAGLEDIVNTDRVDGFPGNFIKTSVLEEVLKPNLVDDLLSKNKRIKRYVSLMRAGKSLFGSPEQKLSYKNVYSAGQGVGAIDQVKSCEEIVFETMNEYQRLKQILP